MSRNFQSSHRLRNALKYTLVCFPLLVSDVAFSQAINFSGSYNHVSNTQHTDPTKPVSTGRSYFTTSTEQLPDGKVKLIVEMWNGELNTPVELYLQVAINDGNGRVKGIPIKTLSPAVADNPTLYYSKREFVLDYQDLNQDLKAVLPANSQHLEIRPGSALFVYGRWTNFNHDWGGIGRGGLFYMPEEPSNNSSRPTLKGKATRSASELDLAYEISNLMAYKYNNVENGQTRGIKVGGQIKSRLEMEGKYQIPLNEADTILQKLFALSKDPKAAAQALGPDWTVQAQTRYMKKDAQGNLILDSRGLPQPDPMVDTYYDSKESLGAQNDVAFRYRWTEQNATGSWNFKPGMGVTTPDGVVSRLEYAVDTTDDKPETIRKFADSMDPLNPFKVLREMVPGSQPSEFLIPSLRLDDTRYKFKFSDKQGLVVEVSLDYVDAISLRNNRKAKFVQLEMDVDHPSTASTNVAKAADAFSQLSGTLDYEMKTFLAGLGSKSFLDGRPVIHTLNDLDSTSEVNKKHEADFRRAQEMILRLRDHSLGQNWLAAPQKNSLAAILLDHVPAAKSSASVRRLESTVRSRRQGGIKIGSLFERAAMKVRCQAIYK